MSQQKLRIHEIFFSLQGESNTSGLPTIFIRLTGCPLRCTYCDTAYAFKGGSLQTTSEILKAIEHYKTKHVCVTGGEPLAQQSVLHLLSTLCDQDYHVSLETSGALNIQDVDERVTIVMDIKTPSSNETDKMRWDNLKLLKPTDQIKFVIGDLDDFTWSKEKVRQLKLDAICQTWFSPCEPNMKHQELANLILEEALPVRFQIQLHKHLWGDVPGK